MIIKFGGEIRVRIGVRKESEELDAGVWSEQDEDYLMSTLGYRTLGFSLWGLASRLGKVRLGSAVVAAQGSPGGEKRLRMPR